MSNWVISTRLMIGTIPPNTPKQRLNVNDSIVQRVSGFSKFINKPGVVAAFNVVNIANAKKNTPDFVEELAIKENNG